MLSKYQKNIKENRAKLVSTPEIQSRVGAHKQRVGRRKENGSLFGVLWLGKMPHRIRVALRPNLIKALFDMKHSNGSIRI